ncbi:unnamed protein product [Rotaria magnacalcarata]|uniref:Retrotransposon gag domain-containing protein n=1 Tax=Rotaria magnacalcarata TaxID=392030 RepID=A0A819ZY65_9BILA|nr:unnamed protein product [Rotaria magnacalcarata]
MAESKVPLETVIKHLSDTLTQQSTAITRLEQTMGSILSEVDTRITTSRAETQQEIKSLETTIASKDTMLTQVFDNIQSLTTGLHELKDLFTNHHTLQSPTLGHPLLNNPLSNIATPIQANSPHFINSSAAISYELPPTNVQPMNTIVLPPTTSLPTFSGKYTERPRQFLIRVEEYARTVNSWSRETLLRGISQFLKDDAFEWYCQLYYTNTTPVDWNQFVVQFLAQFHSPIRAAQQEQAWIECKQFESETINQFVIRLRSIWLEQKPDELESDFTKHLFCKMRSDMLTLMNSSRSSSLDEQRQRDMQKVKFAPQTNYVNHRSSFSSLVKSTYAPSLMDVTSRYRLPTRSSQLPTSIQSTSPQGTNSHGVVVLTIDKRLKCELMDIKELNIIAVRVIIEDQQFVVASIYSPPADQFLLASMSTLLKHSKKTNYHSEQESAMNDPHNTYKWFLNLQQFLVALKLRDRFRHSKKEKDRLRLRTWNILIKQELQAHRQRSWEQFISSVASSNPTTFWHTVKKLNKNKSVEVSAITEKNIVHRSPEDIVMNLAKHFAERHAEPLLDMTKILDKEASELWQLYSTADKDDIKLLSNRSDLRFSEADMTNTFRSLKSEN